MTSPAVVTEQQAEPTVPEVPATETNTTPEPAPTKAEFDYRTLYQDSTRARIAAETELERFRQETKFAAQHEPDISEEELAATPAKAIRDMIRRELQANLGPVNEISEDFRRNKQIANAEEVVFNSYPDLAQYRQALATEVRNKLRNVNNVDPSIYAVTLDATIGEYYRRNVMNQPQNQTTPVQTPAPAPRPTSTSPLKSGDQPKTLTEAERKSARRAGLDPNKPTDVKAFWDIVNNEEGITV